jgi:hypothetical protein
MKHEKLIWDPGTREWICIQCGSASNETNEHSAQEKLDRYHCRPLEGAPKAEAGTETARFTKKTFSTFGASAKPERSGSRFVVRTDEAKPVIQLELFHDTVVGLKTTSVGFELLSGTTLDQAKSLVALMNERIVGVIVTPK